MQEARDDFSTNPKDAGLRIVLPGQDTITSLYHIRVRSSNQSPSQPAGTPALSNPASVGRAFPEVLISCKFDWVRSKNIQALPRTMLIFDTHERVLLCEEFLDIPQFSVKPQKSTQRRGNNNLFANAQHLGNLLQTDRQSLSIAGSIAQPGDIDWFSFDIDYQLLETPLAEYFSTIFDIDYADGIGRADLSLNVFNANGNLIYTSGDSNITDDRSTSLASANNFDLSRGSTGTLDPYLGSVELPAGRYFVAISSRNQTPTSLANRNNRTATNNAANGIRVTPINSNQNIVEDRVGDRLANHCAAPIGLSSCQFVAVLPTALAMYQCTCWEVCHPCFGCLHSESIHG